MIPFTVVLRLQPDGESNLAVLLANSLIPYRVIKFSDAKKARFGQSNWPSSIPVGPPLFSHCCTTGEYG